MQKVDASWNIKPLCLRWLRQKRRFDERDRSVERRQRRNDERDQFGERRSRLQSFKLSDRRDNRQIKPEGQKITQTYMCPLCQDGRPLYLCEEFRRLTVSDRRKYVRLVRDCTYPTCRKCPDDPRKHHHLICTNTVSMLKRGEAVLTFHGHDMEAKQPRKD